MPTPLGRVAGEGVARSQGFNRGLVENGNRKWEEINTKYYYILQTKNFKVNVKVRGERRKGNKRQMDWQTQLFMMMISDDSLSATPAMHR